MATPMKKIKLDTYCVPFQILIIGVVKRKCMKYAFVTFGRKFREKIYFLSKTKIYKT